MNLASSFNDPNRELHIDLKDLLGRSNVNDYAASVKVFAIKANRPH